MPVRTWVGRFTIVEGDAREEGPFLRSFPRQRPDEDEDELYVLVEPATPASKEYAGQLVDVLGRIFIEDPLSTTGAVLRSLKTAHQQLRSWNDRTLPEHRVGAGVSCLAVRGRTAFLTQTGPAVAYHMGDGRVRRIVPDEDAREPLGHPIQIEPVFQRFQLSPGDLLLIASPGLDGLIDSEAVRSILMRGGDDALVELFRLARDQRDFSLVLLACVVEPETEPEPLPAPVAAEERPAETGREPVAAAAPAGEPPAPAAAPFEVTVEAPDEASVAPPAVLTQPKVRLKGAEAEPRYRRSTGIGASLPRVPPALIMALLLIVAAGLLAWYVIPGALEESRGERFNSLVEDARVALERARASQDPGQRRDALRTADAKLQEAEGLRPGDTAVADLRVQVNELKAELDAIFELPALELLVDLTERVPGPLSSRDFVVGGGGAYFLDREQQRIVAVALVGGETEPFVMFEAGGLVGTEIVGPPQHIVWAQDRNALLVLDDARRLIAVTPPGQPATLLTVRDAPSWGSADGIAYRDGSLYVLDRAGDQVWRYPPTENGFDSEREPLLSNMDLEQTVELAVGDAIYLAMADNTVWRAQAGNAQLLTQAGIDRGLASPSSLVPLPDSGRLLIADRGNARIVVLTPDGTFRQQFVSPTFTDLRAIAADEPGGLLYVLVGNALYRTQLPPAQ